MLSMVGSVKPVPVEEALDLLDILIAYETVALTSNLDLIADVKNRLESLGAKVLLTHDETQTKANLFATIGPDVEGGVVLSGHSDVVPVNPADWTTPPFKADLRQGRVYGRGTADMKGFVACVLAMAPFFASLNLKVPVHIALTFDEEDGFHGAPILLADLMERGIRPSAAVIGEPTGLRMVGAHKGCYEYRTTVSGMNGHSSLPGEAVSAVHYATRWISALLSLTDEMEGRAPNPSPYNPPATTFNVGTISGGQGRCVVADLCWFDWEMRPVQVEDAAFVKEHMAAIETGLLNEMKTVFPEASIQTEVICEIDGLDWRVDSKAIDLMKLLLANNEETNHNLKVEVVSYGTEAGLFQASNIPSVLWGPGDIAVAHRPDEFIEVADLKVCLSLLAGLGEHLSS